MKIKIDIWSVKNGKNGKPFAKIETTISLSDEDIENAALKEYLEHYGAEDGVVYEARITETIID